MRAARFLALLAATMLAACAAPEGKSPTYNPIVGGTQTIYLTGYTYEFRSTAPPFYQLPARTGSFEPTEGATCTLRNDKGEWQATIPAEVVVTTSGDLHIECRKQGFKPQKQTLSCSNPKTRGAVGGAFAPLFLSPQLTAFGIVFAPAVVLGAMAAGSVAGSEASAQAAGPEGRDACDYSRTAVGIYFWPDEKIEEPW